MKKFTKLFLSFALLLMGVGGVNAEDGTKTPLLLLKNGVINTTDFDVTPIAPSTLTTDNLYAATFTSTNGNPSNTFQYQNLDVSDYDKAVIVFGEAVANGGAWHINLPSGDNIALTTGITEYEVSLDGVDTYGDFTIFSWFQTGESITISECYLVKSNEPATPVDRCLVYDGEAKTYSWDKQAIYDFPTGIEMEQGKTYIVKADIKSANGGECALWPIDNDSENKNEYGGSDDVQYCASYTTTTSFVTYTWEFEANHPHDRLQFVFGKLDGKIYFDNVSCMEKGTTTEMVVNGDFSKNSTRGWSTNWQGPTFALEEISLDPLATYKEALQAAIAAGQAQNAFAKTEESFATLTSAIKAGETALADADATEESLTAAATAITNAIAGLELAAGYTNLTADMFKKWDDNYTPTTSENVNCAYVLNESTGQPYGDGSVQYLNFADITDFSKLIILTSAGTPRIMMNRLEVGNGGGDGNGGGYVQLTDAPVDGKVEVNLTTYDYAHLNAIKGANFQEVTVTGMLLYRTLTISDAGMASFGTLYKTAELGDATAVYAANYENGYVKLTAVESKTVPAGVGVLVEGSGEIVPTFDVEAGNVTSDLKVSNGTVSGDDIYVLAKKNDVLGFYKLASTDKVPAGKAYLQIAASSREFIPINSEATAIKNIETAKANGTIYNLAGQQVKNAQKGVFVIDGKKVIK